MVFQKSQSFLWFNFSEKKISDRCILYSKIPKIRLQKYLPARYHLFFATDIHFEPSVYFWIKSVWKIVKKNSLQWPLLDHAFRFFQRSFFEFSSTFLGNHRKVYESQKNLRFHARPLPPQWRQYFLGPCRQPGRTAKIATSAYCQIFYVDIFGKRAHHQWESENLSFSTV